MMWTFLSSLSCHIEKAVSIFDLYKHRSLLTSKIPSWSYLSSMNNISANSYESFASLLFSTLWSWWFSISWWVIHSWNFLPLSEKEKSERFKCVMVQCVHTSDSVYQASQSLLDVSLASSSFFLFEFAFWVSIIYWIYILLNSNPADWLVLCVKAAQLGF